MEARTTIQERHGSESVGTAISVSTSVMVRGQFSRNFLYMASYHGAEARKREAEPGVTMLDGPHEACVVASILASVAFLEAVVNEWFQDTADGVGGRTSTLSDHTRKQMKQYWDLTGNGRRSDALLNYQMILLFAGKDALPKGQAPFQDAHLVIGLRNKLIHHKPEWLGDDPNDIERQLKSKFDPNPLAVGSGNPWWPWHCLGAPCAKWALDSVVALTERVSDDIGITPVYRSRIPKS